MAGARMRFLAGTTILIALTLVATFGTAAPGDDPRNISEDYYDAVDDALCMSHHEDQGFRPFLISVVQPYRTLPIGEPVDLDVKLTAPWIHAVLSPSVTLDTSQAPDIEVVTGDRPPNIEKEETATVASGDDHTITETVTVQENASEVRVYAEIVDSGLEGSLAQDPPRIHVALQRGGKGDTDDAADRSEVVLDEDRIKKLGFGTYEVQVWVTSDTEGLAQEHEIRYGLFVDYAATTETAFTFYGEGMLAGGSEVITIPVIIHGEGENLLDFQGFATAHFTHPEGFNAPDHGDFYRFTTMRVNGGEELVLAQNAAAPLPMGANVDVVNLFTRIIGFVSILLVPISMVTGGLFGKKSRRWLNHVTGGAKKRVLWHSAMSWIILTVASIHFLLAIMERQFTWDKGLFWGGIGWGLLVSLGITGYYQVRMIRRWNYKTWRTIHLGAAIGVFAFGIMHAFVDGSDLSGVRETPGFRWLQWLIWP